MSSVVGPDELCYRFAGSRELCLNLADSDVRMTCSSLTDSVRSGHICGLLPG